MNISNPNVALWGFALSTAVVLVWFAGRNTDPISSSLSTGPTTSTPAVAAAPHASSAGPTTRPPGKLTASAVPSRLVGVRPRLETTGFSGSGDISDDAAIWADPADPTRSVVIADNKDKTGGGIGVFDMDGKLIQFRRDGRIGNVDLRTGFPVKESSVVLVGANNRSTSTLELWALNPETRHLSRVRARNIDVTALNYGFCLYHSKVSGKFYAFVTPEKKGFIQQFELLPQASGLIDAKIVRELPISSKTEACVADDEQGKLFVAHEEVAIWKYEAEPSSASAPASVDTVGHGHLEADIEGMSIAYGADGSGYLIVSSQGNSTIAVYGREEGNPFIKRVKIVATATIDAVTGTDGLDVTAQDVGPGFTQGLVVVHDESNSGGGTSNLKYVSLSDILDAS